MNVGGKYHAKKCQEITFKGKIEDKKNKEMKIQEIENFQK